MSKDTLYLEDFELTLQLEVDATWHRGSRGARERGSGVPLEPDEPAGYEIYAIYAAWTDSKGKDHRIDITQCLSIADIDRILEQIDDRDADADEPDWMGARP